MTALQTPPIVEAPVLRPVRLPPAPRPMPAPPAPPAVTSELRPRRWKTLTDPPRV